MRHRVLALVALVVLLGTPLVWSALPGVADGMGIRPVRLLDAARSATAESAWLAGVRARPVDARVVDPGRAVVSVEGPAGDVRDFLYDASTGFVAAAPAGWAHALSAAPDPNDLWLKDFFPVKQGHSWSYTDTNTGEKFKLNCLGQTPIHGVNCWRMQRTRAWPDMDYDLIEVGEHHVRLHYRHIVPRAGSAQEMDLDPAAIFSEAKVTLGKVYSTEPRQINPATGNTTIWTAKVERLENVTVPAGTFPAVKLRLTIKDSKLGTQFAAVEMWYGYMVGLVRRHGQFFGVFFVELLDGHNVPPALAWRR